MNEKMYLLTEWDSDGLVKIHGLFHYSHGWFHLGKFFSENQFEFTDLKEGCVAQNKNKTIFFEEIPLNQPWG